MQTEEEMLRFDQVLEKISNESTSLLLGNGFSVDYNPTFNYENLKDEVFKRAFKGMDVEQIMRNVFKQPKYIVTRIKAGFIRAIGNIHPMRKDDTTIALCATFLKNFSRLYTLNYDVILYWVINSDNELRTKFVDGFGFPKEKRMPNWPNAGRTSTFYLHGSLLLRCDNTERSACPLPPEKCHIEKHTRPTQPSISAISPLTFRLRELMRLGQYPHFVSESDYKQKLSRIQKCTYLKGCYDSLKSEVGNLVTYGVSFKNDQHILVAIKESKIKCCYLGIHLDGKDTAGFLIKKVAKYLRENSHTVKLYDSATARVWH